MPSAPDSLPPLPRWWPRIVVSVLLLAAAAWSAKTIRLETELLALLPQDMPSVRGLDAFSRQFASDREVILVADTTMPAGDAEDIGRGAGGKVVCRHHCKTAVGGNGVAGQSGIADLRIGQAREDLRRAAEVELGDPGKQDEDNRAHANIALRGPR